jgi:hypothetical protein
MGQANRDKCEMSRLLNGLYNLDRVFASLGGAPRQETISSEVGRVARGEAHGHFWFETWVAKRLAHWLDTDTKLWGPDHTGLAIKHADALDAVDKALEQAQSTLHDARVQVNAVKQELPK